MRDQRNRGGSDRRLCFSTAVCLLTGLLARTDRALGGPCYSLDPATYCTQCPGAGCDPACGAYGTYNECECEPFPCDPPTCICSPPADDGVAVCIDPPETWIGLHAKYIVAFGPEFEWQSDPLFAGFLALDQPETCFDKACDDLSRYGTTQCIDNEALTRTMRRFVPVPGGQVEFNVYATEVYPFEPETYFSTTVLSGIRSCGGGSLYSGWPGSGIFYLHPILAAQPSPSQSPETICQGTEIRLIPLFYCNEAYLSSTGNCFDLYKRCPPESNWTPINFGDPLGSALRSGCEIQAIANRPGSAYIRLTGEDAWGRQMDAPLTHYDVVAKCPDCGGGSETDWMDMSFLVNRRCYPNETWDRPIILAEDDCGNEFSVTCTNGAYITSMNGGTCIWTCGLNWWELKRTIGPCGTRISTTFHRTQDRVSTCDRGTCNGVYDFVDTFTSCDGITASSGCCASLIDPGADPNVGCPRSGDCDDSACGPCSCP